MAQIALSELTMAEGDMRSRTCEEVVNIERSEIIDMGDARSRELRIGVMLSTVIGYGDRLRLP